jgi:hypothetical protein
MAAAVDPISAIANAISATADLGVTVIDIFTFKKKSQYEKLPDWLSPVDFQQQDNTGTIAIIGGVLLLVFLIWTIAKK